MLRKKCPWPGVTKALLTLLGGMGLLLLILPHLFLICWVGYRDAEVTFVVTDSVTGQPVPGATIRVHEWNDYADSEKEREKDFRLTTDSQGTATCLCRRCKVWGTKPLFLRGTFAIRLQSWSFQASAPGYAPGQRSQFTLETDQAVRRTEDDGGTLTVPLVLERLPPQLGLFRMAGATTPPFDPEDPKSDPAAGIAFDYFVDGKSGFARAMMPLPERPRGVVWVSALAVVPDERGRERLVGHYSGNPAQTPRYNYNQVLYRLDLDAPALRAVRPARRTSATSLEFIRPSKDRRHFVGAGSGKRFVVWGVNYDHDDAGRLLEDYWGEEWPTVIEDFQEIKALGANVVRVHLQLGKFMDTADRPNAANLARLGRLVRLAEETGLYLDVTGLGCYHKKDVPAWYDKLEEARRWDVQERFWQAVAGVCQDSPAIFCYDLMNEPILAGDRKETEWLAGELAGKCYVQRITLDLAGRSREEVARQWVKRLAAAIRTVDDRHMITVGVIPWAQVFKGARPLFYAPGVGDPLDFVSVHFYPKRGDVKGSLAALKVYEVGKPLVVEEIFPLGCSIEEAGRFIDGSRTFCDGWVSFYWGKTVEENDKAGGLKGALVAEWLRYFRARAPEITGKRQE